ncbi:MAG: hypothetical protein ACRD1T_06865, partial [Acidimicrobiia bacterium]
VKTFGLMTFLQILKDDGQIDDEALRDVKARFRRNFVVDLETSGPEILELGNEEGWDVGSAAYSLTRAAFWANPHDALNTFKEIAVRVAGANREALPGWLGSAVYGAAQGRDANGIAGVAGVLLVYGIFAAGFDPGMFPHLVRAVRSASQDLGGDDPFVLCITQILEVFRQQFHPEIAARLVLDIIRHLPEADRETALRIVLEARG